MSEISIIIPQYQHQELTISLIEQIRSHDSTPAEIIVVDDGSPDLSSLAEEQPFNSFLERELVESSPGLQLVRQEHQGVTAAWNHGIRHSQGNWLVLLNNDVTCGGVFLTRLLKPLLNPAKAVISGAALRTESNLPWQKMAAIREFGKQYLAGWCLAFSRDLFEALGGFDPRFRLYWSDTDFQIRAAQLSGFSLSEGVVGSLPLAHMGHRTTHDRSCIPDQQREWARDRKKFLEKWSK